MDGARRPSCNARGGAKDRLLRALSDPFRLQRVHVNERRGPAHRATVITDPMSVAATIMTPGGD